MLYKVDKNKGNAYMQLYDFLKADIVKGVYAFGTKLPSKRLTAAETGVSVITVQHAYDILCDEGYIESRERSGYFVVFKNADFFTGTKGLDGNKSQEEAEDGSENIGANFSNATVLNSELVEDFPFSLLAKTMRKILLTYDKKILIKSPNCGCIELRQALARYLLRSRGLEVNYQQIIIGSGAEYLYSLIAQLLGREKLFAIEDPSYEIIRQVYEVSGVKVEPLAMGTKGVKSSELQRSKAQVLHVTPYNSFPSGITAPASKRLEYVHWAEERQGFIVEDDFASEFTVSSKMEDTLFKLAANDRVIYMNTFSKTMAPSLRIGYMVLPQTLLEKFNVNLGFYSCTVPVFEQYVLAEFINSGDFERHINRVRRKLRRQ